MATRDVFSTLLDDDILPSRMPDVELISQYLEDGCQHGDPICLSFGETWTQVAPGLAERVDNHPRHSHGYQLSMYGLPTQRRAIRDSLLVEQRLDDVAEPGRDFEVAATWTGTRSAMFDFGRLLLDQHPTDQRVPVVLVAGPSWDYEGVFIPLGYRVRYHHLRPDNGFRPSRDDATWQADDVRARPDERLAMVVVNAQHNPTAVNWDAAMVAGLVRLAVEHDAGVLLDDAYFAVHNDDVTPTPALRIALAELTEAGFPASDRWLAVRSLGKQFHCNGWGVGAMVAHPSVLDRLVNHYRLHNSLMYGGVHQYAMADWLTDSASTDFLRAQQHGYRHKRTMVGDFLRGQLGYPADRVHLGECTSYLMFAVPEAYAQHPVGLESFKRECFQRTGVLFAPAWPWPYPSSTKEFLPYLRMFIGGAEEEIRAALTRVSSAGLHYGMMAASLTG